MPNTTPSESSTLQPVLHALEAANLPRPGLAECAAESAWSDFSEKRRKVPAGVCSQPAPYASHLERVATILREHGFDEEVVAAGYLHDHIEDLPALWSRDRIAREFTPRVAELVDWVTQQDKSLSWEERNASYAMRLQSAPAEAIAISLADKLANMEDLLVWMRQGFRVEQLLKRGWPENSAKLHELARLYDDNVPAPLLRQFLTTLTEFDRLGVQHSQ